MCMCVDQNKTTPPIKEILMSTDLTWPSWPPAKISQVHTIMLHLHYYRRFWRLHIWLGQKDPRSKFHRCIPSCYTSFTKGNFDDYRLDLTKKPPPNQNFTGAYYHVTPPLLKEILMTTDLTWPKRPPLPPGQNFTGAYHHITPSLLQEIQTQQKPRVTEARHNVEKHSLFKLTLASWKEWLFVIGWVLLGRMSGFAV